MDGNRVAREIGEVEELADKAYSEITFDGSPGPSLARAKLTEIASRLKRIGGEVLSEAKGPAAILSIDLDWISQSLRSTGIDYEGHSIPGSIAILAGDTARRRPSSTRSGR